MDFAASAVLDIAAPQPRAETRTAHGDNRAFREHLDAAIEAPVEDAPAPEAIFEKPSPAPKSPTTGEGEPAPELQASAADTQTAPDATLLGGPQPQHAPQPPAPVAVQLMMAQAAPETRSPANAAAQTSTPAQAAPVDVAQPSTTPTTQPGAPTPHAPKKTRDAAKATNSGKETPVAATQTPQIAQSAPTQSSVGPSTTAPATAPAAPIQTSVQTPSETVALAAQAAAAPAPTDPRAAQTPRSAKGAQQAQGVDAKSFAGETPAPRTPIVKGGPKAATAVTSNAKDAGAPVMQLADGAPQTSAAPVAATAQHAAQTQSVALDHNATRAPAATQVAREIVRRFDGESTRFELRLDPPELGRIEVRLEVSRDNRVTAVIASDNPQALTELARHARELEQQLQSAGLELGDNGLSFDLRQGAQSEKDAQSASDTTHGGASGETTQQDATPAARAAVLERWRGVRVDVMA